MNNRLKTISIRIFQRQISIGRLIFPVIIIIGFLLARNLNQNKWGTLISRDFGYQIEYPENWTSQVIKAGRGSDYLHGRINDKFLLPRSYILIYSEPMKNPTFEDGAIWGEEIIKRKCGYICWEGFQTQNIGAEDYLTMTTTYQKNVAFGQTINTTVYIIVVDTGTYMLQFNTYNSTQEIEEIFDRMLDSFKIIEVESAGAKSSTWVVAERTRRATSHILAHCVQFTA